MACSHLHTMSEHADPGTGEVDSRWPRAGRRGTGGTAVGLGLFLEEEDVLGLETVVMVAHIL